MSQNESPTAGAEAPDKATFIAKTTAGILALLLGGLGVHKFYLGFTTPGLIMCLVYYWRNIDMRFGMHPYRHHSAD